MYFPKASLFGRFFATAHALCATEMNCKELPNTGSQDQLLQLSRAKMCARLVQHSPNNIAIMCGRLLPKSFRMQPQRFTAEHRRHFALGRERNRDAVARSCGVQGHITAWSSHSCRKMFLRSVVLMRACVCDCLSVRLASLQCSQHKNAEIFYHQTG